MKWIDINKQTPIWYSNVELKINGVVRQHWHRLTSDGETVYYGSLDTDEIIYETEVSHWRPLQTKKYD